jgi:hypothetical protein
MGAVSGVAVSLLVWRTTPNPSASSPGQCFRFVHNGVGHAKHCPAPVTRHGTFVDGKDKEREVDACDEHAEEPIDDGRK